MPPPSSNYIIELNSSMIRAICHGTTCHIINITYLIMKQSINLEFKKINKLLEKMRRDIQRSIILKQNARRKANK